MSAVAHGVSQSLVGVVVVRVGVAAVVVFVAVVAVLRVFV